MACGGRAPTATEGSDPEQPKDIRQFHPDRRQIGANGRRYGPRGGIGGGAAVELVASTTDSETLLVQQLANTTDQQYLVVLIITTVATTFDRLELREFLLPVAKHMGFDAAQLTDFTDREIPLRRNWGQGVQQRLGGSVVHDVYRD